MESSPNEDQTSDLKSQLSVYSNNIWNRLIQFNFLGKLFNLYHRATTASSPTSRRRRRRKTSLPLPLPSTSLLSLSLKSDSSRVIDVLEDILEHIFLNLHKVEKNIQFWHAIAEGSNAQKVHFMVFERGPRAFIDGTVQLMRGYVTEGTGMQQLCCSASIHISERINLLTSLRYCLATFLAQVYTELDKFGEELVTDPEKSFPLLLVTVSDLFSKLEASIGHFHAARQIDSSVDGSYSSPLMFEKVPEVNLEGSQWTDCEIRDAINIIYHNLDQLDSYLSLLVVKHQKPRNLTRYWLRYTFGVVGVSICSIWLLRHSRLSGSPDIDNWIREAKDSTVSFWSDHVEQPLLSIRDELFETFRKRHKGVMEFEEVQLTANSLHRMLLAFSEQTKGQKLPENASDQEMLEIVMGRYEKELMHPIQSLVGGELARALLIQIQKLKLDIETAMLELNQILRANEINFAILAALPAFFLSLLVLMLLRAWFKQDTRAEGRGRIARLQRRLLIVEVEKRIMQLQTCIDQGLVLNFIHEYQASAAILIEEKDAQCMFGLILCTLDRLYSAVERHAKDTGEWQCLREDIIDLGKPGLETAYKLTVSSRMERIYDCLLPSSKRQ